MLNAVATAEKTVLVVDDDPTTREFVQEVLSPHHYRVLWAQDGLEAVQWTRRSHIDLILMDVRMPLFSGFWFCQAFKHKKNTSNIPIVIMSGLLDEENTEKARRAGACATMKKPFNHEELLEIVEKNAIH